MKKLFTLVAMMFMALGVTAQTTLIDFPNSKDGTSISGTTVEGTVKVHMNTDALPSYVLKNGYVTDGASNGNYILLETTGGFKAGDVLTIAGAINNTDETKRGTVEVFTLNGTEATAVYIFPDFINGRLVDDDPVEYTYTLEADMAKIYLGRNGNTGTNLTLIKVVRGGGQGETPDPQPASETEYYSSTVVDIDGNVTFAKEYGDVCEPEYETVKKTVIGEDGEPVLDENGDPVKEEVQQVKWYRATNVVDGKVVVKIATANVDVEAVGGAVPAKNEDVSGFGGTQAVEADGTVTAWDPINWNLGNHKTDINDEAGTKLYTVMGSGNPYVELLAAEVVKDGEPTGFYKADYVFYEPDGSKGLPIVGLYYRFMPKVDGRFKIQIWANKGNRKTFLVDEDTKLAIPYEVEGYVNGVKVLDENGEKVLNAAGQEMMYFHDNDSIQRMHQVEYDARVDKLMNPGEGKEDQALSLEEAKAQVDAEFPIWIIGKGNQAFWGWLSFNAKAGKKYWLFQHSSQIGFGGYEFTPTPSAGIKEIAGAVQSPAMLKVYNLRGQEVDASYRGIVVKNGKKLFQR